MKFSKKYIPLLFGLATAMGIYIGGKLNFNDSNEKIFATNSKKDKLNRLIDYIDYEYVDQVNTDSIVDVTVNKILENLDPHSVYIPADSYEDNADDMRGNFVGIGVSFYVHRDSIAIIRVIENSSAADQGLKAGDRIIYADNKKLFGAQINRDSISKYLKGKANSKVTLKVYRPSEDNQLEFNVKRKQIPLISVDAHYMINDSLGYIKINRFAETTFSEFKTALFDLKNEGLQSLVLDLRDNPGGYIYAAEKILDEFLPNNTLMLITKNKQGDESKSYATRKGDFEEGKIFVLINENSASASEIIAGAIQDNDRGTIIGRRSFGKGLVQREMALGDGSAVRLTIARYYTPTGRSIQRPYTLGGDQYYDDYLNRYQNGELVLADSIKVADSLKYKTPKGKIVYGGGGIVPDVFIAKDTSIENETLTYVNRNGFMSYFVFEFLDKNRKKWNVYPLHKFLKDFEIPDSLAQEFINKAQLDKAKINLSAYFKELKRLLKANIAQQLYGANAYEIIINQEDNMLIKVQQIAKKAQ